MVIHMMYNVYSNTVNMSVCSQLDTSLSILAGDFHCPITQELMKDPVVAAGKW